MGVHRGHQKSSSKNLSSLIKANLVDEDGGGRIELRHLEEQPDQPLRLAPDLGGQGRRGDVEERGSTLGGHRLGWWLDFVGY